MNGNNKHYSIILHKKIYKIFLYKIISIIMLFFSCYPADVEYVVENNYYYKNMTSKTIKMNVYGKHEFITDYTILPSKTLIIKNKGMEAVGASPFSYPDPTKPIKDILPGDSIYLNFEDERYIIYKRDFSDTSLFYKGVYRRVKISNNENHLHYEFTNEHFDNAIPIDSLPPM